MNLKKPKIAWYKKYMLQ